MTANGGDCGQIDVLMLKWVLDFWHRSPLSPSIILLANIVLQHIMCNYSIHIQPSFWSWWHHYRCNCIAGTDVSCSFKGSLEFCCVHSRSICLITQIYSPLRLFCYHSTHKNSLINHFNTDINNLWGNTSAACCHGTCAWSLPATCNVES